MPTDDFVSFADAVRKEINNNYSKTPVKYPNQPDKTFNKPQDGAWVDVDFGDSGGTAIDIAEKPTFRHPGVLIFNIYVPLEEGDREAREIADDLASIFRFKALDTTLFRTPEFSPVGRIDMDEGAWWQGTLTIPYRRDSTFNV